MKLVLLYCFTFSAPTQNLTAASIGSELLK